jgi:hypothetical protein
MIIDRNNAGKICFNSSDLEIFLEDLFEECRTTHEINYVLMSIQTTAQLCAEERADKMERTINLHENNKA